SARGVWIKYGHVFNPYSRFKIYRISSSTVLYADPKVIGYRAKNFNPERLKLNLVVFISLL
ncbi:MAG: hypothetical protein P8N58_04165, partial [Emcibacteraceae bacterium]|nr:hypothetical protein [Emcibacteraceae bacterium]